MVLLFTAACTVAFIAEMAGFFLWDILQFSDILPLAAYICGDAPVKCLTWLLGGPLNFFVVMPLGSLLGIWLVDRLIFKSPCHHKLGILTGFIMSILGGWFFYVVAAGRVDWLISAYIFPFVIAFFSLIGYNAVSVFRLFKK